MSLPCTPDWSRLCNSGEGYKAVYCPDHPGAWQSGYVYVHRLVVEQDLGRFLEPDELVHHKDENKQNNAVGNLQIVSKKEHAAIHGLLTSKEELHLQCDFCGGMFFRKANQRAAVKGYSKQYCSRPCQARAPRTRKGQAGAATAHGERRSYIKGCRCVLCKDAQTIYMQEYRSRRNLLLLKSKASG